MSQSEKKNLNFPIIFIILFLSVIALKEMAFLILPLAMAIFIAALLIPLFDRMKQLKIPNWSAVIISYILFSIIIRLGILVTEHSEREYIMKSDEIHQKAEHKLFPLLEKAEEYIGIDLANDVNWSSLSSMVTSSEFMESVSPFVHLFNSLVGFYLMTFIYLTILLAGLYSYKNYLNYLGGNRFQEMAVGWVEDLKTYIKVKFFVSFITGTLFYTVCRIFGVEFALQFGVFAFILNFIPQLGSIVATILPSLVGFILIDSYAVATVFMLVLGTIQFIMGNVVEVKFIGKSFTINTVIVFVNLIFWGYVWGLSGVILSAPILILLKNYTKVFQRNTVLARLLSVD